MPLPGPASARATACAASASHFASQNRTFVLDQGVDGLVLTGGASNIEPHHYGQEPAPGEDIRDPGRDAMALAQIGQDRVEVRHCVHGEVDLGVFGLGCAHGSAPPRFEKV